MRPRDIYASFNYAIQGIIYALATQRNMKVHVLLGFLVIVLATVLNVTRLELIVIFLTVGLVLVTELFNTAVESAVNLVTKEYHPVAKVAKNVSAGSVLVAAIVSVFVGYLIFIDYFLALDAAFTRPIFPTHHLLAMALATVILTIISVKALGGHEELVRGGMPSGHTAVAFSLAVAIWYTASGITALLGFASAGLVAQSRIEGKIHSLWEVLAGALIGMLVTVIFFQLKVGS